VTGVGPRRIAVYAVLALVAVLAVLWFWGSVGTAGGHDEPSRRPAASRAPAVLAADGLVVPSGTDVELASGQRYWAPTAHVVVSGVLVVDVTVTTPAGDGNEDVIVVRAPSIQVIEAGSAVEPRRTDGVERRTRPGGSVGFSASFDDVSAEGGDVVTIRVGLADGSEVEFTDVPVRVVLN
jgi:hypothetical protein